MNQTGAIKPEPLILHKQGQIKGRSPDGKVIYAFMNGDQYIGPFENAKPKGRGTFSFQNGDMFESNFDTDENGNLTISGDVVYRWRNGNMYKGEFRISGPEDNLHSFVLCGKGTFIFATGDSYEGDFQNDLFNGTGTYRFTDGSIYTGQFEDGKMHGVGSMTYPDGSTHTGTFKNDLFVN